MQDFTDSQRKPVEEISDQTGQLQDEKISVQKRTFTRWMNMFLQRHNPPLEVHDLFTDIQDGRILMALLEELSGCKLLYRFRSSSQRIFRLNNISKALAFLDNRHVKLLGIDASGIADGIPSVILNLVWNIIMHFQVNEVMGSLQRHLSSSLLPLSLSSYPTTSDLSPQPSDNSYLSNILPRKSRKTANEPKYNGKEIKKTLLQWVQSCTSKYGVDVLDFEKSWRSGLAFLAMIKSINPDLVDLKENLSKEPKDNIQQAFMIAHHNLDVPPLLEPEDVACTSPDEQSIITYVSMFLRHHFSKDEDHTPGIEVPESPNFGSIELVSFGETLTDDPDVQVLLKTFEKSNEQTLWRRWCRRSSGTSWPSLSNQRVLEPPSPLDACLVNQEIQLWMEKNLDYGYGKKRVDGSQTSLSSMEGIYSLSTLDSDEEEAYSYILDQNKDVFQPYSPLKRQVTKVEEETAEEMRKETKYLEACETFNGSGGKHQDAGSNLKSDVMAQSVVHRKFDWDWDKSGLREMTNNRAMFNLNSEAGRRSKEECEDKRLKRMHSNDDCYEEEKGKRTEDARKVKEDYQKAKDEAMIVEVGSCQKYVNKVGVSENSGLVSKMRAIKEDLKRFEKKGPKEENEGEEVSVKKEETGSQKSVTLESFKVQVNKKFTDVACEISRPEAARISTEKDGDRRDDTFKIDLTKKTDHETVSVDFEPVKTEDGKNKELILRSDVTTAAHPGHTIPRKLTDDISEHENSWTLACSATPGSFSEGRLIPALSDITPLELEMLLVLWILLYCYFILRQMIL
ncbi:dystrophin, isoforms A/C/F/G/H isoform X2 [Melanotaenia boesemani]|uniref:dystrophin, isoforms A/C/F/G/H isoform X2 n=1 Tax=Melanotaenia boesemani TaxID=1250792 RepID=UPI001C057F27|nr:dystrophin, isoforms A/C/F/G/H isoform X2 [Melanotaenia boesemani]